MKLAIVTAATKNYLHAWQACIRSIATAASHYADAHFIFVTDESQEAKEAFKLAKNELPDGWHITMLPLPIDEDDKSYNESAQLRIAALQGAGFAFARSKVRADRVLSVESDNIIPADALRVLEWTLDMPTADGSAYYDIAAATYTNGLFLGGFGTQYTPINEDFRPHERKLKPRLKLCMDACEARLRAGGSEKEHKRSRRIAERIKRAAPDGTIWDVIAKHGWTRRGWLDFAYPGIGKGAIVPVDWCGLGCTLLSKKALALADFAGYDGKGTQDLFLCWRRWHPAGLRIATATHVACDHVKKGANGITHHIAYHETDGECRGHLRTRSIPWVG
jgi:hypothetical protein